MIICGWCFCCRITDRNLWDEGYSVSAEYAIDIEGQEAKEVELQVADQSRSSNCSVLGETCLCLCISLLGIVIFAYHLHLAMTALHSKGSY